MPEIHGNKLRFHILLDAPAYRMLMDGKNPKTPTAAHCVNLIYEAIGYRPIKT